MPARHFLTVVTPPTSSTISSHGRLFPWRLGRPLELSVATGRDFCNSGWCVRVVETVSGLWTVESVLESHGLRESFELSIVHVGLETTELRVENETRVATLVVCAVLSSLEPRDSESKARAMCGNTRDRAPPKKSPSRTGPFSIPSLGREYSARWRNSVRRLSSKRGSFVRSISEILDSVF